MVITNEWTRIRGKYTLFEDDAIVAINKPPGISIVGERHGPDLLKLAKEAGETVFPVHRIDKVTSGLTLFATALDVHAGLTRQFARRTVDKSYLAITRSTGLPAEGTIDLPLMTASSGRVRVAANRAAIAFDESRGCWAVPADQIYTHVRSYPSRTTFARIWEGERHTVLAVRPVTGRRHQIRVHLAWVGHPIEGDPLFDKSAVANGKRTLLHSWDLAFDAEWLGGRRIRLEAPPGEDFLGCARKAADYAGDSKAALGLEQARAALARLQERYVRALQEQARIADDDGMDI